MKINFDLVQVFTDLAKTQCVRQSIRKEFANLIFNAEKDVDEIHAILKEKHPGIAYGYVPPADGRERPKFM